MRTIAALKTGLVFFVGGVVLGTVVGTAVLSFDAIARGCFAAVDGAPVCADAVLLALTLWVPAIGATVGIAFVPLLAGAVLAAAGRRFLGRVPLWYAAAMVPPCVLAYLAVGAPWLDAAAPLGHRVALAAAFQAAALGVGWWFDGRHGDRLPQVAWVDPATPAPRDRAGPGSGRDR